MSGPQYIKYDRRRLHRDKRTITVEGSDSHDGKYFKCWNCKFVCDKDRDKTGDGVGYEVVDVVDPYTGISNKTQQVTSGCPFCGSLNWR